MMIIPVTPLPSTDPVQIQHLTCKGTVSNTLALTIPTWTKRIIVSTSGDYPSILICAKNETKGAILGMSDGSPQTVVGYRIDLSWSESALTLTGEGVRHINRAGGNITYTVMG